MKTVGKILKHMREISKTVDGDTYFFMGDFIYDAIKLDFYSTKFDYTIRDLVRSGVIKIDSDNRVHVLKNLDELIEIYEKKESEKEKQQQEKETEEKKEE